MGWGLSRRTLYAKICKTWKSIPCPELVIIDARKRNAASTYNGYDWDLEIPEINLDELSFDESFLVMILI